MLPGGRGGNRSVSAVLHGFSGPVSSRRGRLVAALG
jgi:hypothetical protein